MTSLPGHRTILLVEDDPDIAEAILDILRSAGRSAEYAQDGVVALHKLELLERPCLILLDLMMPRMDGREFLQRLRERVETPMNFRYSSSARIPPRRPPTTPGSSASSRNPFTQSSS